MTSLLLDTNAIIWWLKNTKDKLANNKITEMMNSSAYRKYISSISIAEIAIKASLKKFSGDFQALVDQLDMDVPVHELEFTHIHGFAMADLPWHHKDPFDRMLIAQAMADNLSIITSDRIFEAYGVKVIPLKLT